MTKKKKKSKKKDEKVQFVVLRTKCGKEAYFTGKYQLAEGDVIVDYDVSEAMDMPEGMEFEDVKAGTYGGGGKS